MFGLIVVLLRGIKRRPTRFILLLSFLFLWLLPQFLCQFIFSDDPALVEFFIRVSLFFAGFVAPAIVLFLEERIHSRNILLRILAVTGPILGCLASIPMISPLTINASVDGITVVSTAPFYSVLIISVFATFIIGIIAISSTIRRMRKEHNDVRALQSLRFAFLVAITFNIIGAFFLADYLWSQVLTPLSMASMTILIYISIFKHHLFDIRAFLARSLAYGLGTLTIGFAYGFIAFAVIDTVFFQTSRSSIWQQGVDTVLAVILVFSFPRIKKFFDKTSNRIFYQDAYDSQELLDGINKVLVSTIELDKLLSGVAGVIADTLKTEYCIFWIKEMTGTKERIIGVPQKNFDKREIAAIRAITPTLKVKTVITDELDDDQSKLRTILKKNDIDVLIRLTDTPTKAIEGIGYITLGSKRSGSSYSNQDLKALEIIADELVIAIQNSLRFEEIKNFSITLQQKVDDATRQLRLTNEKLRQLDQTKDDFISMASHQLRTPLTSIKGYVSMVMEGDVGKITKQQYKLLDQAFISSQRMVYLIADLLNVSRLRTGKFVIESKETNLAETIEGELLQLTETAKGRGLELSYTKPKDFPVLMLDETKIRQVIMNFVDNAIYYTPSGGHIKVAVEDTGHTIEFSVSDDGIGVPKSEQHHLFTKFYRAGNAKKARPDGTGLGLFMAKKVVVAQGGTIVFKTQENKGSTFGFSFSKKSLLPENFKGMIAKDEKPEK